MKRARRPTSADEAGNALIEMAIIAPLLLLLLFGVIEFGLLLYKSIGISEGLREAGRQGAVAQYGGNVASCNLAPTDGLVCLAKQRIGVSGTAIHVIAPTNTVGSAFAICATYKSTAITGATVPFVPKYLHSETIMRLEQAPNPGLTTGGDADPEGNNWASCKAPT
jgi:Flp pilus assembly protein TadG